MPLCTFRYNNSTFLHCIRDEIDAAVRSANGGDELVAQSGIVTYAATDHGGSAAAYRYTLNSI